MAPRSLDRVALGALLGVLGAVAAGVLAGKPPDGPAAPPAADAGAALPAEAEAAAPGPLSPVPASADERDLRTTPLVRAVQAAAPAVVSITIEATPSSPFARGPVQAGEGSGVVIQADGVVLTNAHVVQGAERIIATFPDQTAHEAQLIGIAPELDLAVLRLPGGGPRPTVALGTSADLQLGEPVIAIGNPFGLGHTVTQGVVSAVARPLETDQRVYQDFIQTDASINPGNSGGPLLNLAGRLIGINTAIRPDAEGIGFAIPVDRALKVARDLLAFGTVQVPWLGVDVEDGVVRTPQGRRVAVQVVRVHPGTPAELGGLRPGAVLLSVDGRAVQGRSDLNAYLAGLEPGQTVTLGLADGARVSVSTGRLPDEVVQRSIAEVLGVELSADGPPGAGATVARVRPDGAFARAGLRSGDRIIGVNGQPVTDAAALRALLGHAKSSHQTAALLTVRRGSALGSRTLPI